MNICEHQRLLASRALYFVGMLAAAQQRLSVYQALQAAETERAGVFDDRVFCNFSAVPAELGALNPFEQVAQFGVFFAQVGEEVLGQGLEVWALSLARKVLEEVEDAEVEAFFGSGDLGHSIINNYTSVMNQELKKVKEALDAGNQVLAAELGSSLLARDPENKHVTCLLGKALRLNEDFARAREVLEKGRQMSDKPQRDDRLYFEHTRGLVELGLAMQSKGSSAKVKKEGVELALAEQREVVQLRKNKKRWQEYLKDAADLCEMLKAQEMLKEVELVLLEQFNNNELSHADRHRAGIRIFNIDNFYKPQTSLAKVFDELV